MGNVGCRDAWNDDIQELRYQSRNQTAQVRDGRPSRVVARRHCLSRSMLLGRRRRDANRDHTTGFSERDRVRVRWHTWRLVADDGCDGRDMFRAQYIQEQETGHQSHGQPRHRWASKNPREYVCTSGIMESPDPLRNRTVRTYLAMDEVSSWHAAHDSKDCRLG